MVTIGLLQKLPNRLQNEEIAMSYIQRSDIESHIVRRAWNDENFLRELRDDPKGVLIREFNMEGLPDQLQINVHVESDDELHWGTCYCDTRGD